MGSCLEHRKVVKGHLRRREPDPAVDPHAHRVPDPRGRQRGDRVQATGVELELEPEAVLERDRAARRAPRSGPAGSSTTSGGRVSTVSPRSPSQPS